jgi:N-acetylglutamate synthase-like GNAT family acetyltransferase
MIHIRIATEADVPRLHMLIESAYRGESAKQGWTHEADLLGGQRIDQQALQTIIADPVSAILVAERGTGLIGCVQIADMSNGQGYLGLLAVSPMLQAGGVGKQLITAAEATLAASFGAKCVEMTVIKRRLDLIAYYERRGYRATGETRPFPYDDLRFGEAKRDDIDFVVLEKSL